jgi:hypothetical protein
VRELRLQREPVVDLVTCVTCGASSASRLPTDAFCSELYEQGYAAEHVETTQGNAHSLAAHVAHLLGSVALPEQLTVLDFGGSDGASALALAQELLATGKVRRAQLVVIDHVPVQRSADARIELSSVQGLPALPSEMRFDLVLASAVLEHIPHLHGVLLALLSRVGTGGLFYARTPWVAPLVKVWSRLPLMLWPVHVHDLGRPFWNRLVQRESAFALLRSQPSWVETSWRMAPARTGIAHLLKLPGRLDARARPHYVGRWDWPWVGGWEVVLQRTRDEQ